MPQPLLWSCVNLLRVVNLLFALTSKTEVMQPSRRTTSSTAQEMPRYLLSLMRWLLVKVAASGFVSRSPYLPQPVAVNTTADWCSICANTKDRGCAALTLATEQGEAASRPKISSVGAGFLGAGLTLAVIALMAGTLAFLGLLTVGKLRKRRSRLAGVVRELYMCHSG